MVRVNLNSSLLYAATYQDQSALLELERVSIMPDLTASLSGRVCREVCRGSPADHMPGG